MYRELTLEDTLFECGKMWKWLAENHSARKNTYFLERLLEENDSPLHNCFCCEYIIQMADKEDVSFTVKCKSHCPLKNLWMGGADIIPECAYPCEDCKATSPYHLWCEAVTDNKKSKYAQQIADFCFAELEKMKTAV